MTTNATNDSTQITLTDAAALAEDTPAVTDGGETSADLILVGDPVEVVVSRPLMDAQTVEGEVVEVWDRDGVRRLAVESGELGRTVRVDEGEAVLLDRRERVDHVDRELVTDGGQVAAEDDLGAVVARLTDAGPEDARTILPVAQGEALVARDVRGLSRPDAADALGISVYTVDDRLRRARQNVEAVSRTARVLVDLGVLDAADLGVASAQDAQDAPTDAAVEETTEDTAEDSDAASGAWGALMALDSVRRLTRANGVSVYLDRPTDEEVEEVRRILTEDLGLVEFGSDSFETATSGTLRGRYPNAEDAEEEVAAPRELVADLPSATRPAQDAVTRVESGPVDETTEDTAEDDDGEESGETFVCEDCGFEADTPGGLGGHRKSCEARRERLDAEEADVSTLTGIGPKKAEALRSNGFETVLDVAHGNPARGMMKSDVLGGKVLVRAWNEARERLGLADVAPGAEE